MKSPNSNIITDLTKRVIEYRDARDWKQFHSPKDVSTSLMLEAGEVAEHFLWKNQDEIEKHVAKNKNAIGEELSDVLFCVLLMSHDLDIDIVEALVQKIKKNEKNYPISKSKGNIATYAKRHKT